MMMMVRWWCSIKKFNDNDDIIIYVIKRGQYEQAISYAQLKIIKVCLNLLTYTSIILALRRYTQILM